MSNLRIDPGKNRNLEALRGILALMVVVGHVELIRIYFGKSDNYLNPIIYHLGRVAVTGFFVLSGYLITLSILKRRESGKWSIGGFFRRRIFRIWPLYYTMVLLAMFVLPSIDALAFSMPEVITDVRVESSYNLFFLLFLPQVPLLNDAVLPFAEPTWSIGVEELFYLIIPWVVLLAKKNLTTVLIAFIVLFMAVKYYLFYGQGLPITAMSLKTMIIHQFDCIALGCLLGELAFRKNKYFHAITHWHLAVGLIGIIVAFNLLKLESFDYFPFAACFALIIIYFANSEKRIKSPKWLVYIGQISYSLYLTHEIAIVYLINRDVDSGGPEWAYLVCAITAIGVASVFYVCIEQPFMKLGRSNFLKRKQS